MTDTDTHSMDERLREIRDYAERYNPDKGFQDSGSRHRQTLLEAYDKLLADYEALRRTQSEGAVRTEGVDDNPQSGLIEEHWPQAGDLMRFLNANGYPRERENAAEVLSTNCWYEVEDCDVQEWSHTVKFKGVDGRFNGVMFERRAASLPQPTAGSIGEDESLRKRIAELEALVYVPGQWRCPKCKFVLMQMKLRASDGAVGVRDEPGEPCPNCQSPLWRVTERDAGNELADRLAEELSRASTPAQSGVVEAVIARAEQACRYALKHQNFEGDETEYQLGWEIAAGVCGGAIRAHVLRHLDEDLATPSNPVPVVESEELREAAAAFLAKVEELTPGIDGMFQIAAIHGASWPKDANWVAERDALKAVLATVPSMQTDARPQATEGE